MKNLVNIYRFLIVTLFICSCGGGSGGSSDLGGASEIDFNISSAQSFDPTAEHGRIRTYKLEVMDENGVTTETKYFSPNSDQINLNGLQSGSVIKLKLEALNVNNRVVRRGYSKKIQVRGGQSTPVSLTFYNVPIISNLADNALVYQNSFVPKVFAPGGIEFEIIDQFNGSKNILQDSMTKQSQFSFALTDLESNQSVYIEPLQVGTHNLTVRDVNTGEASTISIRVLSSLTHKIIPTTAGDYLGSVQMQNSNLIYVNELLVQ